MTTVPRPPIVWTSEPETAAASPLGRFADEHGFGTDEYDALWRWSVAEPATFWRDAAAFIDLDVELGEVDHNGVAEMAGHRFFPEGRLNLAHNLLRGEPTRTAVHEANAGGVVRSLTYAELRREVEAVASHLRSRGVGEGAVVATVAPNNVSSLVSFLATVAVGASWTSCSPDFSSSAILDRIGQVAPSVLFVSSGYDYNGKHFDYRERIDELVGNLDALDTVIVTGPVEAGVLEPRDGERRVAYADVAKDDGDFDWTTFAFDTPALIMYTSGTTGKPKAIVHSGGGILLKMATEHAFHTGLEEHDTTLWYTNIAWMMFHWLALSLARRGTIVLYDDSPVLSREDGPDHGPLWRLVESCGITTIGISPGFVAAMQDAGFEPSSPADLSTVRHMMTSGSPLSPEQFQWLHTQVPPARIAPISGGTELLSSFVGGSPLHDVRAGEMSCRILGQAVDVVDERGASIVGRKGELVCTEPFPSMPLTFFGPGGDDRYRAAYFGVTPNVWTHGDLAEITISGGVVIHGRSDNTLNPGGVRIGTAEVYRPLESIPEITDAVVFGRPFGHDERIVLCVVMREGSALDDAMVDRIRTTIRAQASPRHVPHEIVAVRGVPYTQNGKRVEGAAKRAATGGDVTRYTSLANPEVLVDYTALAHRG